MDSRHSAVAENALLELAYRSSDSQLKQNHPLVLVLLTGHFIGMDEGLAAIRTLARSGARLKLAVDGPLAEIMSLRDVASQSGVDDILSPADLRTFPATGAELLFIPVLSLSLLARLAQLDTADPLVSLAVQSLCAGKPVAALQLGATPGHYRWAEQGLSQASPALTQELQRKLDLIASYGVNLLEPDEVTGWPAKAAGRVPKKQVLTAADVQDAMKLNRPGIVLGRTAVITPLAADLARQAGIELTLKEKG
ncbi:hypothetical protein [Paenibacillus tengchongensis]|uniref:hypothetical protein n=1 Tax=Paenibacillus tengchongensis TaxID=2608684 RepID=UPI00124C579E|nr:hypothetical protein [Paenibacillus tengchongensis]